MNVELGCGLHTALPSCSSDVLKQLRNAGFKRIQDIIRLQPSTLAKELNIDKDKALLVISECKKLLEIENNTNSKPKTALELYNESKAGLRSIVTFCQPLDEMLGGGIPIGELTELSGMPGAGKTQLCMQLAVDVTIPTNFGGLGGDAIYIDTEGSVVIERLREIANAMLKHINMQHSKQSDKPLENYSCVEDILSKIHYCHIHNYTDQLAVARAIPSLMKQYKNVRLIIVDSVAFHFRAGFDDMGQRTRSLNSYAQQLNDCANEYSLAVCLTNQMTTRNQQDNFHVVPALGESWSHAVTNRLLLSVTDRECEVKTKLPHSSADESLSGHSHSHPNQVYIKTPIRSAQLIKSASRVSNSAEYIVVTEGIRRPQIKRHKGNSDQSQETKRIKTL